MFVGKVIKTMTVSMACSVFDLMEALDDFPISSSRSVHFKSHIAWK